MSPSPPVPFWAIYAEKECYRVTRRLTWTNPPEALQSRPCNARSEPKGNRMKRYEKPRLVAAGSFRGRHQAGGDRALRVRRRPAGRGGEPAA
ncbi:keywimysin-related RiPP [Nonomuraea jabiensis]|uniref:keywimysin-related RiPP n=1 Tax=Nonomuraea jabiensis TaxID=882448 RepID=UPI0035E44F48